MIRKAVIPVAGLGTRLAPATRAVPKTMFPLIDTPVLHYVVEEAVDAGISEIALVVGSNQEVIRHYFEPENDHLATVFDRASVRFINQLELNGLGGAIVCAKDFIADDPFAVLLGDSITRAETPVIGQLIFAFGKLQGPVIGVEKVDPSKVSRYGIIDGKEVAEGVYRIEDLVEKPEPATAPSNIAIAGRYVLPPEIISMMEALPGAGSGELQLTDAIRGLLSSSVVHALLFEGRRFDIGSGLDFLQTSLMLAMERDQWRGEITDLLKRLAP